MSQPLLPIGMKTQISMLSLPESPYLKLDGMKLKLKNTEGRK
jgi:hypothetical protein